MESALYVAPNLAEVAIVAEEFAATTERHRLALRLGPTTQCLDPLAELRRRRDLLGVVIGMERGWPGSSHLRFAARALKEGRRVWLYWPSETAIECIDRERLGSYWRHWAVITGFRAKRRIAGLFGSREFDPGPELVERYTAALARLTQDARPVPLVRAAGVPTVDNRIDGTGVYLRTDYWVEISSGGSYGHTCYVAKELAAVTQRFVCLMANRYAMLDDSGLRQVVMPRASDSASEIALLASTWHYYPILKVTLDALRPAYIYERLVLGNLTGALLSHELNIPYILEYNGSEISMSRSFDGKGLQYEELFTRAEDAVFKQATIINVVSQVVKDSLVTRGVDPDKVLVNPNGADPAVYAPRSVEEKRTIRAECGFADDDCVIGFTGTFGGWHGIDVLAAAIPGICARAPRAKWLLVGDGSHKPLVDQVVTTHHLEDRVRSTGRVPQSEGARLLAACDLCVSPHNSHMVDSKFFGSPTKLFEYMAMGAGIVGSDLEQLGEVLSPALRVADFSRPGLRVTTERAVLVTPGDVEEFTDAVVALVEHPDIARCLGRNARQAVIDSYSWQQHVAKVWRFLLEGAVPFARSRGRELQRLQTGDDYKEEVQNQWNNNPVGPQYAKVTRPHTLAWFKEIEAHRYGEYGPWMREVMEFDRHAGQDVLEIGAGIGTDLSQFAQGGARVTDLDLSAGHLQLAQENFALRGLTGRFIHHDAESLPFGDHEFDVVYSNGVLHHTPNTRAVVREILRVLRPGGRAIIMMYAENSWHYWGRLVGELGLRNDMLKKYSMGEIMSRSVEITQNDARPLVKVYTARRLRALFEGFTDRTVYKRQLMAAEVPDGLKWIPLDLAGRLMGWNVIIKATKPPA